MKREFLTTGDGSITIHLPEWNEPYHSKHGAINEAKHVFIETGLEYIAGRLPSKNISILEIGFGTGLNALLTKKTATINSWSIKYTGIEANPVTIEEASKLNYPSLIGVSTEEFIEMHQSLWEETSQLSSSFQLTKRKQFFEQIEDKDQYDLIYFDAFGARVQPELWTESIFQLMFDALRQEGTLVTYSAKGSVRRAMLAVGFQVERLPGPPGKREMLRALKPILQFD